MTNDKNQVRKTVGKMVDVMEAAHLYVTINGTSGMVEFLMEHFGLSKKMTIKVLNLVYGAMEEIK